MASFSSPLAPQPPTTFTFKGAATNGGPVIGGVLVGDYVNNSSTVPAGSAYNVPTVTTNGGYPVSAQVEFQSTTGALLIMRLTTAQRNALPNVVNGMMIYNSDTTTFQFYQGGAWVSLSAGAGGVIGPGGGSTDKAVARWDGAGGNTLQNSVVLISDTGAVTGILTVAAGLGSVSAPSYTFTGETNTGMYQSVTGVIDFTTLGVRQFQVSRTASAVNYAVALGGATNGANAALQPGFSVAGSDTNIDFGVNGKGTGGLAILASNTGVAASAKWWNGANTFYTSLAAGVNTANVALTLPITAAAYANQPLVSDASGNLSFNSAGMMSLTGTLTSANLLGMYAAPVIMITAPGANKAIVIHRFEIEHVFVSAAYAAGGATLLQYGNTVHGGGPAATGTLTFAGLWDQVASTASAAAGAMTGVARTALVNTAVYISNDTAAFTTGDGTAQYTVWYSIVTV